MPEWYFFSNVSLARTAIYSTCTRVLPVSRPCLEIVGIHRVLRVIAPAYRSSACTQGPLSLSSLSEKARHFIYQPMIRTNVFLSNLTACLLQHVIPCFISFNVNTSFHVSCSENLVARPRSGPGLFASELKVESSRLLRCMLFPFYAALDGYLS